MSGQKGTYHTSCYLRNDKDLKPTQKQKRDQSKEKRCRELKEEKSAREYITSWHAESVSKGYLSKGYQSGKSSE